MQINAAGLDIIKRNEGCELKAYQDVVGIWTIGYGHTGMVHPGMTITQERAEELLREDLAIFEQGVTEALKIGHMTTNSNQFSAMVSLAYNIGLAHFRASTVLREHIAANWLAAADAFLLWDKAGGVVRTGLLRRRHEERALYLAA